MAGCQNRHKPNKLVTLWKKEKKTHRHNTQSKNILRDAKWQRYKITFYNRSLDPCYFCFCFSLFCCYHCPITNKAIHIDFNTLALQPTVSRLSLQQTPTLATINESNWYMAELPCLILIWRQKVQRDHSPADRRSVWYAQDMRPCFSMQQLIWCPWSTRAYMALNKCNYYYYYYYYYILHSTTTWMVDFRLTTGNDVMCACNSDRMSVASRFGFLPTWQLYSSGCNSWHSCCSRRIMDTKVRKEDE